MALKNLKKIDSKLQDIYKDQVTTTVAVQPQPFVDRSELFFVKPKRHHITLIAWNYVFYFIPDFIRNQVFFVNFE